MLSEYPVPFNEDVATRRIFSPFSYSLVRNRSIVPIVHVEASRLAPWFPIAWQRQDASNELVVVRSFVEDGRAQPSGSRNDVSLLPLLLRAYPFVLDPTVPPSPVSSQMFDDVVADEPTDVGASVTTVDRKLSLATELRLQELEVFVQHYSMTQRLTRTLANLDLFEPWNLKFDIGDKTVYVPDLLIVRQSAFETGVFSAILEEFEVAAANLLGLHRISLFRAGILLAAARSVVQSATADPAP